ncbi:methylated-DNA--[protein]-cysteine S-methyltransferase [Actinopolymorpha singaporensis]
MTSQTSATTTHTCTIGSPVGALTLRSNGTHLTQLHFTGDAPLDRGDLDDDPVLTAAVEQLDAYFAGERTEFDLPLDPGGTAFQRRVWAALREIPYAETETYGELARRIGSPTASRAVGAANGQNPIAIVVPCHRVVGANGKLVGFGGGVDRKVVLLEREAKVRLERDFG